MRRALAALLALGAAACAAGPPEPVAIDTINDQCAACRMVISDPSFAAQVVARYEEPRLYDDLRCLRDGLAALPAAPEARIFVADRRTREWVAAGAAVYVRAAGVATPMASHLVAYADEASRQGDPQGRTGEVTTLAAILDAATGPAPEGAP